MSMLLGYQKTVITACQQNDVVVIEKGRRTGITWTLGYFALDQSAMGTNVFYIGYNLDMTRDFIQIVEGWAKGLSYLFDNESLYIDPEDKDAVQALKINTKNGARVHALTSKPRSLRGKQGVIIIDEAAFHDDLEALLTAALPLLMLGGKVIVISTHLGKANAFFRLCEDIRQGRKPYCLLRITFGDAIADGYYGMVCERKGETYSPEGETAYVQRIRAMQTNPAQELDCIAANSEGAYFSRVLLESRTEQIPVLRFGDEELENAAPRHRQIIVDAWLKDNIDPFNFGDFVRYGVGVDVGRDHDLTVAWIFGVAQDLRRKTVLVIELQKMPHPQQAQIIAGTLEKLPRRFTGKVDSLGIGSFLAEALADETQRRVTGIALNLRFYAEQFPRFKAALEDDKTILPADASLVDDFFQVSVIDGIPKIPKKTAQSDRHADGAVAGLLAWFATHEQDFDVEFLTDEIVARECIGDHYVA